MDSTTIGSRPKIREPIAVPTTIAARTQAQIEGVTNTTVLSYINNMNANDFKVTGKVQTPWFGSSIGMNIA